MAASRCTAPSNTSSLVLAHRQKLREFSSARTWVINNLCRMTSRFYVPCSASAETLSNIKIASLEELKSKRIEAKDNSQESSKTPLSPTSSNPIQPPVSPPAQQKTMPPSSPPPYKSTASSVPTIIKPSLSLASALFFTNAANSETRSTTASQSGHTLVTSDNVPHQTSKHLKPHPPNRESSRPFPQYR